MGYFFLNVTAYEVELRRAYEDFRQHFALSWFSNPVISLNNSLAKLLRNSTKYYAHSGKICISLPTVAKLIQFSEIAHGGTGMRFLITSSSNKICFLLCYCLQRQLKNASGLRVWFS